MLHPEQVSAEDVFDEGVIEEAGARVADIASRAAVHDRFQFEAGIDYDLLAGDPGARKRYEVEMYLYVPTAMGIRSDTYARDRFWADLTNHLRLRTPDVGRWDAITPDAWSLPSLERYFEHHLHHDERQRLIPLVVQEAKLFGCLLYTQLKALSGDHSPGVPREGLRTDQRLAKVVALLKAYRRLYIAILTEQPVIVDDEVRRALGLVDEYLSYRLEASLITFVGRAEQGTEPARLADVARQALSDEISYRRLAGFVYIGGEASEGASAEAFAYRLGLLKKFVTSVLYLDVESVKKEGLYKNAVAGAGAAVAAVITAMVDFQRFKAVAANDWGWRVFAVVGIGVFAYVFQDRIKDIAREWFNDRLKRYLPDHEQRLLHAHYEEDGRAHRVLIATCRQFMRWLKPHGVPPEIRYIRETGSRGTLDPDRSEVVIHYFKRLAIQPNALAAELAHVRLIRDVVRFDLSEFLVKLADPSKQLAYFHEEAGVVTVEAPKVYHLNAVFRYAVVEERPGAPARHRVAFERARIVVNKRGILRMEQVVPRGDLGYHEEDG